MIRMALDIYGNRVWIDHAEYQLSYYCQECGGRLVPKKGKIRLPHFAHYNPQNEMERECNERNKRYEMSEWHRSWQERFPEECREVVFTNYSGEKGELTSI